MTAMASLDSSLRYTSFQYMPNGRVEEYASQGGPHRVERTLDVVLALAVLNGQLDVADYLLARGADIHTTPRRCNPHAGPGRGGRQTSRPHRYPGQ
jgi:hypothetical protein